MSASPHAVMSEAPPGCRPGRQVQTVQPFSTAGTLAANLNPSLQDLTRRFRGLRVQTYSYVVRSVRFDPTPGRFEQRGSAPNFQGGVLTLCTCKHRMRSCLSASDWESDVWLAGFTSRTRHEGRHWLFYLAKVESAHESHGDLWEALPPGCRKAKAAHLNHLGDLFQPRSPKPTGDARYSPDRYIAPDVGRHTHRSRSDDTGWENDICYRKAAKFGHPPLLVAEPERTFLWSEPKVALKATLGRGHVKRSLSDLFAGIEEIGA